ncbi:ABC transporter ATP-binding protein [bacterium D16-50]|jgi:ABC-type multidrug transport system fused ATPase/permease subunit|nr:ABC transporter ATP-binding protein [Lachnospiraceae bacterium]RKJ21297.1 ABC transporter ATP-binding protein [bacterium D16-50]
MKDFVQNIRYYVQIVWQSEKRYFVVFAVLTMAMAAGPIAGILLPKIVIRDILALDQTRLVLDIGVLAAISMSASFLISYYSLKNDALFLRLGFKLKETLQRKAMQMAFADTEDPAVLNSLSSAMSSVNCFVTALHKAGTGFFSNSIILVFYLVLAIELQPLLLLLPFMNIAISLFFEDRVKKYEYERRNERADIARKRDYTFSLMYDYGYGKEIRLFGIKDWVINIYRQYQHQYEMFLTRVAGKRKSVVAVDLLFTFFREGAVYFYLVGRYLKGGLTVDSFVLYTGVFASFAAVGLNLVQMGAELIDTARQVHIYRDFAEKEREQKCGIAELPLADSYGFEFDHVSFRYPGSEKYILKDFCCKVEAGTHVALVGRNGAGKSTIVKLLCGLYTNYEGIIRVGGIDLRTLDLRKYQDRIAAVFQESRTIPATVLENITLKEENSLEEVRRAQEALRLIGLYDKVESLPKKLETPVGKAIDPDGVELSGGERQNLVICRALYRGGGILLLDEPTAALDALAEHEVYTHFHEISQGRTTLFISHRLNSTRFCDEIWLLDQGRITERGSHEELYQKGGDYKDMFSTQAQYYREQGRQEGEAKNGEAI